MEETKIKTLVEDFIDLSGESVEVTTGNHFNMPNTINKISLYKASKFKSGDKDSQGNKKFFYNIITQAVINAQKNLDLDTKDVLIKATKPEYRINSLVYNDLFNQYVKETGLGIRINKLIEVLSTYGSCITKQTKDGFKVVNMNKIMIDPGVSNLDNSFDLQGAYAIEKVTMTYSELEEMKSKWNTDEVIQVLESFKKSNKGDSNKTEIPIYESYVYSPNEYFDDGDDGYGFHKVILTLDSKKTEFNEDLNDTEADVVGRVLFTEEIEKIPYKKIDYYTIEGRNLGYGVVEVLFDPQQRVNEIKHDVKLSMNISAKHLFQTADDTLARNIQRDLRNGDIIKTKNGINPVSTEERNLPAWNVEIDNWSNIGRQNTNSPEVMTGETLPSNQTLGGQQISTVQAAKFFDLLREQIGLFLKENLKDFVLPKFENTPLKDIVEMTTPETIKVIAERDINRRVNDKIIRAILNKKTDVNVKPSKQETDIMKQREMENISKEQFVKASKEFLKFEKKIDIIITGEGKNLMQEISSITQIINMISNPAMLQDPTMKRLLDMLLEDIGIDEGLFGKGTVQPVPTPQAQGQQVKAKIDAEAVTPGPSPVTPKV